MDTETFIGPFKVLGVSEVPEKTPSGAEVLKVTYDGGLSQLMPKKAFESIKTTEPTDLTTLSDKKLALVRDAMISALMEYDCTAIEVEMVLKKISNKLANAFDRAGHYLFTKEVYGEDQDRTWVPGSNFTHYRSVVEVDKILKQIGKDDASATTISDK